MSSAKIILSWPDPAPTLKFVDTNLAQMKSGISIAWVLDHVETERNAVGFVKLASNAKVTDFFPQSPENCLFTMKKDVVEISCSLDSDLRRRGLMSEARRPIIAWAFAALKFRRIHSEVWDGNESSLKMNERLGFKKDGVLRAFNDGKDIAVLSLIREDVKNLPEYRAWLQMCESAWKAKVTSKKGAAAIPGGS